MSKARPLACEFRNPKSAIRNHPRRAFTLIEVVLAIALTAVVVYLLSTATELYLANVDASRTRVETAQLARTLLDQIADDLTSARLAPPAAAMRPAGGAEVSPGGAGGSQGGPNAGAPGGQPGAAPGGGGAPGGGAPGGSPAGGAGPAGSGTLPAGGSAPAPSVGNEGIYGTADQLRIDRTPYANWERASREVDVQEAATQADMPISVRYFFVDDKRLSSQKLAQQGVARESSPQSAGGLYRETVPTGTLAPTDPPLPARDAVRAGAQVELLAPEVVGFALTYYDGTQLLSEWDVTLDQGLPLGVEIVLTVAEPRFDPRPSQDEQQRLAEGRYLESELVEYRRFVRLPLVAASPAAQALLPADASAGGGPAGYGQAGASQPGGSQPGGAQGGQSGGGSGAQQGGP